MMFALFFIFWRILQIVTLVSSCSCFFFFLLPNAMQKP